MLVFIDESGDSGRKIESGSSRFFVVALTVFEEDDEATACDQRIALLRRELGLPESHEFHFKENSRKMRLEFLKAIAKYNFFYYGIVLNKDPQKLWGDGFNHKSSLYKYTCGLVFENAKAHLQNARVKIDKSGTAVFSSELAKYLRQKANSDGQTRIKWVKVEPSRGNNLLQLADYVAGIINRKAQDKKDSDEYRRYIAAKEIFVQTWPK